MSTQLAAQEMEDHFKSLLRLIPSTEKGYFRWMMKNVVKVNVHTFQYKLVWTFFFFYFSIWTAGDYHEGWGKFTGVTISASNSVRACKLSRFSHVQLWATPWTKAHEAPLFMGFSRQEYWSGLGCHALLQGICPTQGMNPCLLCLLYWQVGSWLLALPGKPASK